MKAVQIPQSYSVSQARLLELRKAAGPGPVLIMTHDNPDPDGLASGKALAVLLESAWQIPYHMVYSGLIARSENIAMLRLLTPEWEHVDTLEDLDKFSALALVDTQPTAGNNSLPDDIVGWLDGRSSLARLGLMVHVTAHRIDPGWSGNIVLEFFNSGKLPLALKPGMSIGAISFEQMTGTAERPYRKRTDAKYRDQNGPIASRISEDN